MNIASQIVESLLGDEQMLHGLPGGERPELGDREIRFLQKCKERFVQERTAAGLSPEQAQQAWEQVEERFVHLALYDDEVRAAHGWRV